jgi:hypothetical protein
MSILRYAAPIIAAAVGCTEPRAVERAAPPPSPAVEARIDLSDSTARAGSEVIARVRLSGKSAPGVASVTARLTFDSTALRFVAEESLADGATRAMNPAAGQLRFAAVAASGFAGGQLYAMRFAVLRSGAFQSLRLTVDEMHTAARTDATSSLVPEKP